MRQPLVIDIHAHYYPESYMRVLGERPGHRQEAVIREWRLVKRQIV